MSDTARSAVSNTQPVQIRAERNAIYVKHPSHFSGSVNSPAAVGFVEKYPHVSFI